MEENEETGVIYMIYNTDNDLLYIGKAFSYVKHGKKPIRKHGIEGRLDAHIRKANNGSDEIPLLYDAMRKIGTHKFGVKLLEVCSKSDLKQKETEYIKNLSTHLSDKGYNYHLGDSKPQDAEYKKAYELKKAEANVKRAVNGALRRSEDVKSLPQNIYKRKLGYFAQIKIDGKLFNKAFFISTDSDEEKLNKAIEWLGKIKN